MDEKANRMNDEDDAKPVTEPAAEEPGVWQ
jgi:hypothetical protein